MTHPDLTGQRFARLVVTGRHGIVQNRLLWNCLCDCGRTIRASRYNLRKGYIVSCGCKRREGLDVPTVLREKSIVNPVTQCWEWQGTRSKAGYGRMMLSLGSRLAGGKSLMTHRLAYTHFIGPIPDGLHVLHKCDNPPCCNPEHLWIGTHQDNMSDMLAKGRHRSRKRKPKPDQTMQEQRK